MAFIGEDDGSFSACLAQFLSATEAAFERSQATLTSMLEEMRELRAESRQICRAFEEGVLQDLAAFSEAFGKKDEILPESQQGGFVSPIPEPQNINSATEISKHPVLGKISSQISRFVPHVLFKGLPTRTVDDFMEFAFDGSSRNTHLFDPGGIDCVKDCGGFDHTVSSSFARFQRWFLAIYTLSSVMKGLWLVYGESEFESYGLSKDSRVFYLCVGYSTSLVLGPVLGVLSDLIGQKRICLLYCVLHLNPEVENRPATADCVNDNGGFLFVSHPLEASVMADLVDSLIVGLAKKPKPEVLPQVRTFLFPPGVDILVAPTVHDHVKAMVMLSLQPTYVRPKLLNVDEIVERQKFSGMVQTLVESPNTNRIWKPGGTFCERELGVEMFCCLADFGVGLQLNFCIKGNEKKKNHMVEAEMDCVRQTTTLMDLVNAANVANLNLRALDIFASVIITLLSGLPELPGSTIVQLKVVESKSPLTAHLETFTTAEARSSSMEGSLKYKNIFGYGDIWDASLAYACDNSAEVGLGMHLPRLRGRPTSFTSRVYLSTQAWLKFSSYKERALGVSLGILSSQSHELVYTIVGNKREAEALNAEEVYSQRHLRTHGIMCEVVRAPQVFHILKGGWTNMGTFCLRQILQELTQFTLSAVLFQVKHKWRVRHFKPVSALVFVLRQETHQLVVHGVSLFSTSGEAGILQRRAGGGRKEHGRFMQSKLLKNWKFKFKRRMLLLLEVYLQSSA